MMKKDEVANLLVSKGFVLEQSGLGDDYFIAIGTEWKIMAFCPFEGNPFLGNVDKNNYEEVNIHLNSKNDEMAGTNHICHTEQSLTDNIDIILAKLKNNSENEDMLKCPKCKIRYVHPKTPTSGQKWKPFLSCSGMMVIGKDKNKWVLCDGVSKKLPAVINY